MAERQLLEPVARVLIIAGLAFASCLMVEYLAFATPVKVLLWPASAIALAFGWRFGLRWIVPAAIGAAAWAMVSFGNTQVALSAALVCVAGPGLAVTVLQRLNAWKPAEYRLEAVLRFIVVILLLATPLNAILATSALGYTGLIDQAGSPHAFVAWWLLDALGMLLVAPVVLAGIAKTSRPPAAAESDQVAGQWFDSSATVLAAALTLVMLAVGLAGQQAYSHALLYFYFPLTAWISVRMSERATAYTLLLTAVPLLAARAYLVQGGDEAFARTMDASVIVLCATMVGLVLQAVASDRRLALMKVARQARQDMSTGLLNDRGLLAELGDRLVLPSRTHYGLIGVHLTNFDAVNDLCGPMQALQLEQTAADLLLKQPGAQIGARLTSGRYVLLIGADTVAQVRAVARELYSQLNGQVFRIEHGSLRLQVCVAGLLIDKHVLINSEDCMMSLSDAMAIAASVRDPQLFVEPLSQSTIDSRRAHQGKMEHIREAIREERFEVHAQRIVDPDALDGMISYEVLTRLRNADGTIIRPPEFLPLAMQAQMTVALDRGVIRNVFAYLALNPDALARTHKCSINLSGMTMSDGGISSHIREQRTLYNIPPEKIVFEITESEAIRNPAAASRLVEDLKSDGFGIALDDFGTGLATFEYLKRFPLDYLKIDGSFIRNLMTNPIDEEIVLSTIRVARHLKVKTVAEHVHSREIYDRLTALGVEYLQGEIVSAARPIAEMFADVSVLPVAGAALGMVTGSLARAPVSAANAQSTVMAFTVTQSVTEIVNEAVAETSTQALPITLDKLPASQVRPRVDVP